MLYIVNSPENNRTNDIASTILESSAVRHETEKNIITTTIRNNECGAPLSIYYNPNTK